MLLASCGGGGGGGAGSGCGANNNPGGTGGNSKVSFNVSATSLVFSAESPAAPRPATQNLVGTVTGDLSSLSGTLYVLVDVKGTAVTSVPIAIDSSNASGTGTV